MHFHLVLMLSVLSPEKGRFWQEYNWGRLMSAL
jgi:hypothetical protein